MQKIELSYDLSYQNSFRVKSIADFYFEFETNEQLIGFIRTDIKNYTPVRIIGDGCNVLLSGRRVEGLLIHSINRIVEKTIEDENSVTVKVGAGYEWDSFVLYCLNNKWFGLENLSGIPGSAGASPVQNIGAYGVEAGDFITKVEAIDLNSGTVKVFTHDECRFGYRMSIFKMQEYKTFIITNVYYKLHKTPNLNLSYNALNDDIKHISDPTPLDVRASVLKIRNSKLPDHKIIGNAGSFFKNPVLEQSISDRLISLYPNIPYWQQPDGNVKLSAAWFIEQCGFKGCTLPSGAGAYKFQPLILINEGGAQGSDILHFAYSIIEKVKIDFGVELEPEVNIW